MGHRIISCSGYRFIWGEGWSYCMLILILTIIAAPVISAQQSTSSLTFTASTCPNTGSSAIQLNKAVLSTANGILTITATGTASSVLNGGDADISIFFLGNLVEEVHQPICSATACPIQPGTFTLSNKLPLPSGVPIEALAGLSVKMILSDAMTPVNLSSTLQISGVKLASNVTSSTSSLPVTTTTPFSTTLSSSISSTSLWSTQSTASTSTSSSVGSTMYPSSVTTPSSWIASTTSTISSIAVSTSTSTSSASATAPTTVSSLGASTTATSSSTTSPSSTVATPSSAPTTIASTTFTSSVSTSTFSAASKSLPLTTSSHLRIPTAISTSAPILTSTVVQLFAVPASLSSNTRLLQKRSVQYGCAILASADATSNVTSPASLAQYDLAKAELALTRMAQVVTYVTGAAFALNLIQVASGAWSSSLSSSVFKVQDVYTSFAGHASSPGIMDLVGFLQVSVFAAQLNVAYPVIYQSYMQNFQWAVLLITPSAVADTLRSIGILPSQPVASLFKRDLGVSSQTGLFRLCSFAGISPNNLFIVTLAMTLFLWAIALAASLLIVALVSLYSFLCTSTSVDRNQGNYRNPDAPSVVDKVVAFCNGNIMRIFALSYFPLAVTAIFQLVITYTPSLVGIVGATHPVWITVLACLVLSVNCVGIFVYCAMRLLKVKPSSVLYEDLIWLLSYGPLYNDFRQKRYHFFIASFMYKLSSALIIGGLGTVAANDSGLIQVVALAATELIFLLALISTRPYTDSFSNNVHLLISLFRMIGAGFLFLYLPFVGFGDTLRSWLGLAQVGLNGVVVLCLLIILIKNALVGMFRFFKRRCCCCNNSGNLSRSEEGRTREQDDLYAHRMEKDLPVLPDVPNDPYLQTLIWKKQQEADQGMSASRDQLANLSPAQSGFMYSSSGGVVGFVDPAYSNHVAFQQSPPSHTGHFHQNTFPFQQLPQQYVQNPGHAQYPQFAPPQWSSIPSQQSHHAYPFTQQGLPYSQQQYYSYPNVSLEFNSSSGSTPWQQSDIENPQHSPVNGFGQAESLPQAAAGVSSFHQRHPTAPVGGSYNSSAPYHVSTDESPTPPLSSAD